MGNLHMGCPPPRKYHNVMSAIADKFINNRMKHVHDTLLQRVQSRHTMTREQTETQSGKGLGASYTFR